MATSNKIITLQNVDDEDFTFEYNASEGNPPYLIKAGEVVRYPEFLAKKANEKLITKILNKRGERTDNRTLRLELADQIIIDTEKIAQVTEPTETEKLRQEVTKLNQPSTLDTILRKRKAEKKQTEKVQERVEKGKSEIEEKFEGLPEAKPEEPKVEEKLTEEPKPKEVKAKPTREELYTHAKTKMNLVIDQPDKDGKTLEQKFSKMKIDDLITELDYPMED